MQCFGDLSRDYISDTCLTSGIYFATSRVTISLAGIKIIISLGWIVFLATAPRYSPMYEIPNFLNYAWLLL